jgi:hypothetical protein
VPVRLQLAIALGLVAGLLLGLAAAVTQFPPLVIIAEGVEPIGIAFVDLLKMVVIPLVAAVIFVGVSSLGDLRRLGRMGGAAMGFFALTSVVGVLLGMGVMRALLPLASDAAAQAITAQTVEAPALPDLIDFLLSLIPSNPFQAAAEGLDSMDCTGRHLRAGRTGHRPCRLGDASEPHRFRRRRVGRTGNLRHSRVRADRSVPRSQVGREVPQRVREPAGHSGSYCLIAGNSAGDARGGR